MANLLSTTVNGQLNTGNVIDLGYTVNGSISTTAFRGINFHSFSDYNYLIGKRAGAWTQPLDITFYTGIKYHAHRAYGGHKFYTGGFDSSFALSIGDGDGNVRIENTLHIGDNSTGLYLEGSRLRVRSTSVDNVAQFATYGMYLPQTGQEAGLYVESPIEARGGLRIGSDASSGTITVGAATSVVANRIVQRDANGYIYANHINFSTSESENPAISSFITSNGDGWSRKSSLAHVRNQLGNYGGWITTDGRAYPRRSDGTGINFWWDGQGGQPTWLWGSNNGVDFYVWNPSNFSVNFANSSTSAAYLNYTGVGGTQINANTFGYGRASNYYGTSQIINSPEGAYASLYNFGGSSESALSLQMFASVNHNDTASTRNLWFRVGNNLGFQNDWKQVIHSGNIASQSVSYAVTSGTSSATTQTNFAELFIENVAVATKEFVTSQGYLTSLPSHNHDDRYFTESESDGRFFFAQSSQLANTNLNDLTTRGVYYSADQYGTNENIPFANYFTMINLTNDSGRQAQLWFGDTPGNAYWRPRQGDSIWHPWEKLITSNNIGSQSVSYASSAGNADTVDGFHASVAASANTIPTRNASGYLIPESWIQLNGIYGLYSPTNNAHLRPNSGSYGSWQMTGSRNGWQGIEFDSGSAGNVTLMVATDSNTSGFHNNSYGWQIRWANGILYVGKGSYGGGADATVWDSSNAPRANFGNLMYYQGFELDANTMATNSTGFTYANNAPFYGPIARFSTGGNYDLWIGGAYSGGGNAFYLRTRNGDAGTFNAWREIITSGNIASQSVSYADESGYSASSGSVEWTSVQNKPATFPPSSHTHDDRYYTESESDGRYLRSDIYNTANAGLQVFRNIGTIDGSWPDASHTLGLENNDAGTIVVNFHRAGYTSHNLWYNGSQFRFDQVVTSTADFRAPIFYDSADTGYYLDPNGTSNLSRLLVPNASSGASLIVGNNNTSRVIDDNNRKGLVVNADYYPHIYVNALSSASNDVHGAVISMTGVLSAGGYRRWGMGIANTNPSALSWGWWDNESNPHYSVGGTLGYTSTGSRMWLDTGGNLQTTGSMRAPIFYDSDDTTYYLDPNAASRVRNLYVGDNNSNWSDPGGWGTQFHVSNGPHSIIRVYARNEGIETIMFSHIGGQSKVGSGTNHDFSIVRNFSDRMTFYSGYTYANGYLQAADSLRAPIFYDSDNTNRYLDLNSTAADAMVISGGIHISRDNVTGNGIILADDGDIVDLNDGYCAMRFSYGVRIHSANRAGGAVHTLHSDGNAYFNTSAQTPIFLVNSHSDNTKGYRIYNTSNSSVSAMFVNSSNQLVIAAGAVDQVNLNKKVYVNGVALGVNVSPSGTAGRIDASNDIVAYSSSDERLKHNITPIENALDKVKSLTGVEFDWKPEHKHAHGYEGHDTGIIAQQVQAVMPSAVRTNETGFLAVRYEKLIGLLIEANKELAARVEELEKKLN